MSTQLVTIILSALGGGGVVAVLVWLYLNRRSNPVEPDFSPPEREENPQETATDHAPGDPESRANQLLATMSHEIRTPLNGVLGMLQLLHDTNLSREQRRIVRTVLDSGQVLSQVVDDHLTYFRLESGHEIVSSPGVCELESLVHQTMMLFQGLAFEKGLDFVLTCDAAAPHVVRTDTLRLRQILSNLVLNAIKYTDEGEVLVSIEQVDGKTEIAVSDTGPGMTDEVVDNLFAPFFRAESSAANEKGTGLGLVIARRLADVVGAELDVDSEPGMGTTFSVRFDFETLLVAPPDPPALPWDRALIFGAGPGSSTALAHLLERLGIQARVVDAAGVRGSGPSDLVFDFSRSETSRAGVGAIQTAQSSPPGAARWSDIVRIEVMPLSDPRAHQRDEERHVLIAPFSRSTVLHTLSELAGGARRTSTIDLWRQSMADSFPLSILVAEDDRVSSQVIAGMLENLGYQPTLVDNGPAAVEALRGRRFEVALLDLNLPGFGGMEIVARAGDQPTWWIAMSASVQPELRRRCRDAGFRDFLPKPLGAGELQSALVRGAKRDSGVVGGGEVVDPSERATHLSIKPSSEAIGRMREIFSQSPAAYRDLLKSHIEQTDLLCADLEMTLHKQGDEETARRATHTLQAAAASFGCNQVASHARTLEAEWEALTIERRHTLTRRLIEAWRREERATIVRELEALPNERR